MGRAARMHVNCRTELRETPRRARVIEMNVAEKNMAHVFRLRANPRQFRGDVFESGFGARIEKRHALVALERSGRDDPRPPELSGIENVNRRVGHNELR